MRTLLVLVPLLAVAACNKANDTTHGAAPKTSTDMTKHDGSKTTAVDQSNAQVDLDHVAAIRKAIVADDSLSISAKNVVVVTRAGQVTLRGSVASTAERTRVEELARGVAATSAIDNQIQVESK